MDCRETQPLLTAFHDGELPEADRARVDAHLRSCTECGARLAGLARVDAAASVPDPGPGYWDRFNARVMDRVEREAEGPKETVLRSKHGWMRQQLRYLVPAVAAAAMVVVVVRYGGLHSGAPTPVVPPAVREPAEAARRVPEGSKRVAKAPAEGHGRPSAGTGRDVRGSAVQALPDRPLSEAKEGTSRDRAAAPAGIDTPAPAAEPQLAARKESASGVRIGEDRAAEAPAAAPLGKSRSNAGPSAPVSASPRAASPCELARTLAARKRWREAEAAQRACLAQGGSAPARENGLVFLAELLDRQERFAEADAVIAEVDRQFPHSRPLDLYRQQRPMVQKQPMGVPGTR